METNQLPESPVYSPIPSGNNTLAIVSLGLGLAGIPFLCVAIVFAFCGCVTGLLAIGAVVTGFIARQQIKSTGERGDGMALTGIILGIVQVVIVAGAVVVSIVLLMISLIANGGASG